nr:ribonuclease H-like domain-containing protein [Tanacetum cinerariifolium]
MITRSQVGTFKPNPWFHGHTSHISPLPKSHSVALSVPHWRDAMYDEYNALIKNGTWILVPKPPNLNVVRSMWLFWHKYHADGSLNRYKARLVASGCNQQYRVDCSDTFSLVVKPTTIRTVLSLALARNWPVYQLDVKNAFLNDYLTETIYMYQPLGFVDSRFPHHVCRLQQSLYGLKQAPRAWFQHFVGYALRVGFTSSRCDSSLFIYQHGTEATLSRFSAEAEYRGVANVVAETAWILCYESCIIPCLLLLLFTVIMLEYEYVVLNPTSLGFVAVLAVLITGASQSRQHGKSESDSCYLSD